MALSSVDVKPVIQLSGREDIFKLFIYRILFLETKMSITDTITKEIQTLANKKPPIVVAVCGAADLGKSFLSEKIVTTLNSSQVGSACYLSLDSFLMPRAERIKLGISGYQPQAYDFNAIENLIIEFKEQKGIAYFPYDHSKGENIKEAVFLDPCNVLILDGLHSMHEKLWSHISFSLFIYTDDNQLRQIRREADLVKRKQSIEFSKRLEPIEFEKYKQYVEPYKNQANCFLKLEKRWVCALEMR